SYHLLSLSLTSCHSRPPPSPLSPYTTLFRSCEPATWPCLRPRKLPLDPRAYLPPTALQAGFSMRGLAPWTPDWFRAHSEPRASFCAPSLYHSASPCCTSTLSLGRLDCCAILNGPSSSGRQSCHSEMEVD